jgi:succinoglycan biosynthesis transport protein ExoP
VSEYDDFEAGGLPSFLWDPGGVIRRRWRWMLATLLVGLLATGFAASQMKDRYRAGATVMIATQEMPEDFVRSTVRGDPFQRINAMLGEVLARRNLTTLIEEHGLYLGLQGAVPLGDLANQMRGDISVEAEDGISGRSRFETARLLRIEYESDDPETAAVIANRLAGLLVDEGIRLRSHQAALAANFMTSELERAEAELREHDKKITQFKQLHRGELPADLESSLRALTRLQEQRESLALQIAETESRLATLSAADVDSPDAQLQQLNAELSDLLSRLTEKHPDVIAVRRQIRQTEALVAAGAGSSASASPSTLVSSSRRTLEELRRQRASGEVRIRELEQRVARIPERQEALEALEQKESVLQRTYTDFLRKVQEAELAQSLEQAQQGARISLVERAQRPLHPTRERWKVIGAGVFAAFVVAFAVGLLFELVDPVLLLPSDARFVEEIPILGSIPWIR